MDILLIYPPISVDERYGGRHLGGAGGHLPPLGIASIAAFLRKSGFSVGIVDAPASNLTTEDILGVIGKLSPKAIGISAITPVFHRAVKLASAIRTEFPGKLILLGGHHASILPAETLRDNPAFDIIIKGEGELTAHELMEKYRACGFAKEKLLSDVNSLGEVAGIAFRKQSEIVLTAARGPIDDLDTLPFPAWEMLPMDKYLPLPNQYLRKPVVHMVAIRGCPYKCSFCSNNAVFGRKIRAISPPRLLEIMKYAKSGFGAREISFWDDSMTVDNKWLIEVCRGIIAERLNLSWTCYSRVDTVNKEILLLMKKAGCWNIFYGYETASQELLDVIGKGISPRLIEQVNQWTKEAGIEVRASFMIGLPRETPEMAQRTIDFAVSLEPDYAQFCVTTPFPGTRLFQEAAQYGALSNDFSRYNIWEPVFVPHGYRDKEEIEEMVRRAFRTFYLRPKYIFGRLLKIRSFSDILRCLKGMVMAFGFSFKKL